MRSGPVWRAPFDRRAPGRGTSAGPAWSLRSFPFPTVPLVCTGSLPQRAVADDRFTRSARQACLSLPPPRVVSRMSKTTVGCPLTTQRGSLDPHTRKSDVSLFLLDSSDVPPRAIPTSETGAVGWGGGKRDRVLCAIGTARASFCGRKQGRVRSCLVEDALRLLPRVPHPCLLRGAAGGRGIGPGWDCPFGVGRGTIDRKPNGSTESHAPIVRRMDGLHPGIGKEGRARRTKKGKWAGIPREGHVSDGNGTNSDEQGEREWKRSNATSTSKPTIDKDEGF